MNNSYKIEIPISKLKITLLLLGSVAFLLVGTWLLFMNVDEYNPIWAVESLVVNVASVLGMLMGLFGVYFFTKKLFDTKPGLVIDELGLIDNSGGLSIGRIYWTDIVGIQDYYVQAGMASKQKFVSIFLDNPADYIARQPNSLKRKMMKANEKYSGTPVSISANGLRISFDELLVLIEEKFADANNGN